MLIIIQVERRVLFLNSHQDNLNKKSYLSILLTFILVLITIAQFFISKSFPNMSLNISIIILLLVDLGFIVSLVLGLRSKIKGIAIFSVLANSTLFILLSILIFLLAFSNGISEP